MILTISCYICIAYDLLDGLFIIGRLDLIASIIDCMNTSYSFIHYFLTKHFARFCITGIPFVIFNLDSYRGSSTAALASKGGLQVSTLQVSAHM